MKSLFILFTSIFTLIFLLTLLSSPSCLSTHPFTSSQGLVVGEKTRLGSTPPSCHNKCNTCHPCMAVQVPTLPRNEPVQPKPGRTVNPVVFFDSPRNKYSNYKPLGWRVCSSEGTRIIEPFFEFGCLGQTRTCLGLGSTINPIPKAFKKDNDVIRGGGKWSCWPAPTEGQTRGPTGWLERYGKNSARSLSIATKHDLSCRCGGVVGVQHGESCRKILAKEEVKLFVFE
ncbi:hypothetical protein TIFTF001_004373 [Ficus carica]|uniref:Epidermal patterning factor-like protein n=1 Tax=Ficus carica TaxID=3494 RepID=A0AA87ZV08_FICCA|nr:hypothetical protein TIFTF001_004373 [Ficus carica]